MVIIPLCTFPKPMPTEGMCDLFLLLPIVEISDIMFDATSSIGPQEAVLHGDYFPLHVSVPLPTVEMLLPTVERAVLCVDEQPGPTHEGAVPHGGHRRGGAGRQGHHRLHLRLCREERRHRGLAQEDQQPEAPATRPAL